MSPARFWTMAVVVSLASGSLVVIAARTVRPSPPRASGLPVAQRPPPSVDIVSVLRAMQLVTVQIDAGVRSTSQHDSWRGDVLASVLAPARYYYAVDLSELKPADIRIDGPAQAMTLRVPAPRRLAVEVLPEQRADRVRVSGTRLRDVAGEYHLGLARMGLYDQARRAELLPDDQRRLVELSARQIESLVRTLSGHRGPVRVEFDPPGAAPGDDAPRADADR